jgi:hypothetical protein
VDHPRGPRCAVIHSDLLTPGGGSSLWITRSWAAGVVAVGIELPWPAAAGTRTVIHSDLLSFPGGYSLWIIPAARTAW